ncbi:MAG: sulfotransferase, partial [Trichodesmium sp. St2_bin2_1]|nr:sulfotransferase [Trichodesmium sp. St2_bin2_1]
MESPIFIVGCERSGNTLLRLILNQSPVLYIPSESGFLDKLRKQQELYGDFTELHQRWFFIRDLQTNKATSKTHSFPIFKLTLEEAEVAIAETAPTNYSGAAFALFQAATRKQGKQYWGDKTPRYIFDIPWLAEAFPQAKFIHIIRDGRDVASSLIKAGWVNNFVKAAYYWQKKVEAGISARKILE